MSKHTPGPWNAYGFTVIGPNQRFTANTASKQPGDENYNDPATVDEDKANAKLIAAAPELLEIVRRVVERETNLQDKNRNYHDEELQSWSDLIDRIDN